MFVHTEPSVVYVSPTGTGDGSTEATATELQNALTSENIIAGDTIMMLDGKYTGEYTVTVTGTAENKIIIKPKNAYAATIDGTFTIGDGGGVNGNYVRARNLICMQSTTDRGTWETSGNELPDVTRVSGYYSDIINCLIHDGGLGMGHQQVSDYGIIYGNVIWNNGWADDVLGGAQNLYFQGTGKIIKHNIFGGAFKKSFAGYGVNATIEDCLIDQNVIFSRTSALIGASSETCNNITVHENHVVNNLLQIGYTNEINGVAIVNGNRVYSPSEACSMQWWSNLTMNGNVFVAGISAVSDGFLWVEDNASEVTWNLLNNNYYYLGQQPNVAFKVEGEGWYSWAQWNALGRDAVGSTFAIIAPTANEIFVYPNEYPDTDDPRVGIVVIWNWAGDNTVAIDLTDLGLEIGTTYRWRQAQDPLVDIGTWVCDGNSHAFAMTGHTVAKPIGFDEELIPTQFPTFGCFIIEKVV